MNKNIFLIVFCTVLFSSFSVFADDGQVKISISAKVTASTCVVVSDSSSSVVQMISSSLTNISIGTPFGQTPFSISLDYCPPTTSVAHVKFTGISDTDMPNLLKLDSAGDGYAKGIALGLYDENQQNLDIRSNSTDFKLNSTVVRNKLGFIVAYVRTLPESSQGKVSATASFEISYD
ncbi:fimbrial protein [Utexia brackfieldae]|uniref:fimbrial protein n=1 Tax=Utexia brackfieldae TaxID=3074108 RepID=UPI00370D9DB4